MVTMVKAALKEKESAKEPEQTIVYPRLIVGVPVAGINPTEVVGDVITLAIAKKLIGWDEEKPQTDSDPGRTFGGNHDLVDENGVKVRCWNNLGNRPFVREDALVRAQDILTRNWRFNCEPIIVSRHGQVISGQHRLIGLVFACQIWAGSQAEHWRQYWKTEPTIHSLVVLGADDSQETIRTIDSGRIRSEEDVLTTMGYFAADGKANQAKLIRLLTAEIRLLWARTGAYEDAYSPSRTHSELVDFIKRHGNDGGKLFDCVKHIWEESENLPKLVPPSLACGLLYLMGCSASDGDAYRYDKDGKGAHGRTDKTLDWDNWEKAMEFWTLIASDAKDITTALKAAHVTEIQKFVDSEGKEHTNETKKFILKNGVNAEKSALLIKAWGAFLENGKVTAKDVTLAYRTDEDGTYLDEFPLITGIDVGEGKKEEEVDPEPDEVQQEQRRIRGERNAKANAKVLASEAPKDGKELWEWLRNKYPQRLLLFRKPQAYQAWFDDATAIAKLLKVPQRNRDGITQAEFPPKELDNNVLKLAEAGYKVAVVAREGKELIVEDAVPVTGKKVPSKK